MQRVADPTWTDFSRYPHEELIRALSASNPAALVAAGDTWALTASALQERAEDVAQHGARLATGWSGAAAENYRTMVAELVDGTRRLGAAATAARDLVYAAAEALAAAWNTMPPVSSEAARRQAVLIMAELAERYLEVAGELSETMSRLLPGAVDPASGQPALPSAGLVFGDPAGGAAGHGQQPLFGRMLPAGLAAAGAVLGRPFVPSLLTGRPGMPPPASPAAPGLETPADDVVMDPMAGAQPAAGLDALSGGGGLGGGGLGGAGLPALPEVHAEAAGHSSLAGSAGIAAATGGAVAAARSGLLAPPMMPMGMMGAGGEGGTSRRLPAWLVETENIWGEAAVVTSPVIGEEPDARWW